LAKEAPRDYSASRAGREVPSFFGGTTPEERRECLRPRMGAESVPGAVFLAPLFLLLFEIVFLAPSASR
jgi:hypothetical protein